MASPIHFWLNDREIFAEDAPGLLLLDYLRRNRRLVGTKEGCKEGDCGACTVMIGELRDGRVQYLPVTSCLVPLGEMHGRHVVTIEGLNHVRGLNPVQEVMVRRGGAQCGFCTPGFVVSMAWYLMNERARPTREGMKRAISGNLCRCTGYGSIMRATDDLVAAFSDGGEAHHVWTADDRVGALVEAGMLPEYFARIPARLAAIAPLELEPPHQGDAPDFFVAGGTDLYVQKGEHVPGAQVRILNHHPEIKGIRLVDGKLRVGALTTFEEFAADQNVRRMIPDIDAYMFLIASLQLRNRATLSGNIINASPIGDMTNMLLALDTELVFQSRSGRRVVPMKSFFLGYKVYDKRPDEVMTEIVFPLTGPETRINFEKISKRTALDIATVNSAIQIRFGEGGRIEHVNITAGGVAATPKYLAATCDYLVGKTLDATTREEAYRIAQSEISPIGDIRGSAEYKRLLVRQLMEAHFELVTNPASAARRHDILLAPAT